MALLHRKTKPKTGIKPGKKLQLFCYLYKNYILIIDNKISKTLDGPSIFLGITLFFLGFVFLLQQSWVIGFGFLILASFLFFTFSGIEINTETHKIKSYYKLFGLIKKGSWESLNQYKGVTLVPMKKMRSTYSRSNRQVSTSEKYFMIYLVNTDNKPALPIKKCKTRDAAQNSLDEFSIWLKMPVFSVKH